MNDAKSNILQRISTAIKAKSRSDREDDYISEPFIIARYQDKRQWLNQFVTAGLQQNTIIHQCGRSQITKILIDCLSKTQIEQVVCAQECSTLLDCKLFEQYSIDYCFGSATMLTQVAVTACVCAVAETGTLVLASGVNHETNLNFLPKTHVVLLEKNQIVGSYEEAWEKISVLPYQPRTVNFISGSSRTGDIEQKIYLGIHGPLELIVIIYTNE